ncbi:hypothetical protein [Thauera humireducens]|uniref:hypothetical protein n=1 Tax=Thauera humireducens TaxID=1134435 RepID=UPI00311E5646
MDDSGSARAIAHAIVNKVGSQRAVLAIVLACGILTYGGVSLFVVAFAVYPIGAALFREAGIPKRLIPAAIALGSFTFTMTALPGTPAIQNAIPSPFFGTDAFAAPGLGLIGGLIMFGLGTWWLSAQRAQADGRRRRLRPPQRRARQRAGRCAAPGLLDRAAADPGGDRPQLRDGQAGAARHRYQLPRQARVRRPAGRALADRHLVDHRRTVGGGAAAGGDALGALGRPDEDDQRGLLRLDAADPQHRDRSRLRHRDRLARRFRGDPRPGAGHRAGQPADLGGGSGERARRHHRLGFRRHVDRAQDAGRGIPRHGHRRRHQPELLHRVAAMASGCMDTMPHNGAVISLLAICRLTHRESYGFIAMNTVVFPLVALVVVITLGTLFGNF